MKKTILFLGIILGISQVVNAQENESGVVSELKAFRITVDIDEGEQATEVTEISPGDLIEYRLTYTNNLGNSISELKPVLPIPAGMQYVPDTANPSLHQASVSTSGDNFGSLPLRRQVTLPSGLQTSEEVPQEEFRRLQWMVDTLGAGESVQLVARVRVIEN